MQGGGIYNDSGATYIRDNSFIGDPQELKGNIAGSGGAIFTVRGTLVIDSSTVIGNAGGGWMLRRLLATQVVP